MEKKAQTGSTITWFVGFLVIVFILFLFITLSVPKTITQKISRQDSEIKMDESIETTRSKQQRQMFILLENEYGNKKFYDIFKEFVSHVVLNKEDNIKSTEKELLDISLKEILERNSGENCFKIYIINKTKSTDMSGAGMGVVITNFPHYYIFPVNSQRYDDPYNINLNTPIERYYSFFFPEKPFALIKYIETECQTDKKNG